MIRKVLTHPYCCPNVHEYAIFIYSNQLQLFDLCPFSVEHGTDNRFQRFGIIFHYTLSPLRRQPKQQKEKTTKD